MASKHGNIINVLHVVSKLTVGGVEKTVFQEITGYDKNKFRGSACCIMEGGEIAEALKGEGVKVEVLHKMKGHGFDWGIIKALYRLIKKDNIHVLRTHQYHPNLYGRIAGALAGVPAIVPTFHNSYVSPNKPKFHRRLLNYMLGFASHAMVPVSQFIASELVKYDRADPEKIRVIYNGIKTDDFNVEISKGEARNIFDLPYDHTIVGCVGRLADGKGHRYLIESVSGVENITVAICGDGPLMSDLKNLARHYKVNCIFTGKLSYRQVPEFMKSLDIYCSPSLWEGFGMGLIEAMAAGLPVIASDLPSHAEITGEAGILFTAGNAEELKKSILQLIEDRQLRDLLIRNAKERAELFSLENTVKLYEKLFEEILKSKQGHHLS